MAEAKGLSLLVEPFRYVVPGKGTSERAKENQMKELKGVIEATDKIVNDTILRTASRFIGWTTENIGHPAFMKTLKGLRRLDQWAVNSVGFRSNDPYALVKLNYPQITLDFGVYRSNIVNGVEQNKHRIDALEAIRKAPDPYKAIAQLANDMLANALVKWQGKKAFDAAVKEAEANPKGRAAITFNAIRNRVLDQMLAIFAPETQFVVWEDELYSNADDLAVAKHIRAHFDRIANAFALNVAHNRPAYPIQIRITATPNMPGFRSFPVSVDLEEDDWLMHDRGGNVVDFDLDAVRDHLGVEANGQLKADYSVQNYPSPLQYFQDYMLNPTLAGLIDKNPQLRKDINDDPVILQELMRGLYKMFMGAIDPSGLILDAVVPIKDGSPTLQRKMYEGDALSPDKFRTDLFDGIKVKSVDFPGYELLPGTEAEAISYLLDRVGKSKADLKVDPTTLTREQLLTIMDVKAENFSNYNAIHTSWAKISQSINIVDAALGTYLAGNSDAAKKLSDLKKFFSAVGLMFLTESLRQFEPALPEPEKTELPKNTRYMIERWWQSGQLEPMEFGGKRYTMNWAANNVPDPLRAERVLDWMAQYLSRDLGKVQAQQAQSGTRRSQTIQLDMPALRGLILGMAGISDFTLENRKNQILQVNKENKTEQDLDTWAREIGDRNMRWNQIILQRAAIAPDIYRQAIREVRTDLDNYSAQIEPQLKSMNLAANPGLDATRQAILQSFQTLKHRINLEMERLNQTRLNEINRDLPIQMTTFSTNYATNGVQANAAAGLLSSLLTKDPMNFAYSENNAGATSRGQITQARKAIEDRINDINANLNNGNVNRINVMELFNNMQAMRQELATMYTPSAADSRLKQAISTQLDTLQTRMGDIYNALQNAKNRLDELARLEKTFNNPPAPNP